MGSVKGKPSSMMSREESTDCTEDHESHLPAPPASRPSSMSTDSAVVGKPAVTYVTSAARFSFLHCANVFLIASMAKVSSQLIVKLAEKTALERTKNKGNSQKAPPHSPGLTHSGLLKHSW